MIILKAFELDKIAVSSNKRGAIYLKAVLPEDRKQSGVKDFWRLQHREMSDAVKDMNAKPLERDLSAAKRPFLRIDSLDRRAV